jgi:hypothetical protein
MFNSSKLLKLAEIMSTSVSTTSRRCPDLAGYAQEWIDYKHASGIAELQKFKMQTSIKLSS